MPKKKSLTAVADNQREKEYNTTENMRYYTRNDPFEGVSKSLVICVPRRLEEVQGLIDILKEKQPLIMDLTGLNGHIACRMLDFMSGAVYALSGNMQNYKGNFYLVTPNGCGIKNFNGAE